MALEALHLEALMQFVPREKVIFYGYPDFLLGEEALAHFGLSGVPEAEDGARVAGWHGFKGKVINTDLALRKLGFDPVYFDVSPSRGCELKIDLNFPVDYPQVGAVVDLGTGEHCFNIGQVFMTTARLVRLGGAVLHAHPMSMVNHGFYNICPGAYRDFYEANGFETLAQAAYRGPLSGRQVQAIDDIAFKRFTPPAESMQLYIGRKKGYIAPLGWPTQQKYRLNKELKA